MGQMRKAKRLVTLGIAGIVLTSSLVAAPAFADSGAGATPAPLTSADQGLSDRINELVSAYDTSTKTFDPSAVTEETLASDEGRAFIAAVSLGDDTTGASVGELDGLFTELRDKLAESNASIVTGTTGNADDGSYALAPGVTITFPDDPGAFASVFVTGGSDPFPYIQLTGAEQQAMVTGASGTLVVAICALLGPETAGVGCGVGAAVIAMIVGIIVANGVCKNSRQMRIYPLAGPAGFSCQ